MLENKTAIITGASSGIGYATARLFAAHGAQVIAAARRQNELDRLAAEIDAAGGRVVALAGDVRDEVFCKTLVDVAVGRFGGLDVAFNNAGALGEMGPVPDLSAEGFRATLENNLVSAFLCARYQIPALVERGGGSLIFTASFVGHTVGMPGTGAYAASKAGMIGLMKTIAVEFGSKGVRANALLPGGTDTPAYRTMATTPEAEAFIAGLHALKRVATPDEIARAALYLACDDSAFTTGAALLADGGVSVTRS